MSWNIDWHIHTTLSPDGTATVEEYCEKAVEMGLSGVGFSDHYDPGPDHLSSSFYDYGACREAVTRAREKFRDRLQIHFGIEIGYQIAADSVIRTFLRDHDFDYHIGSIHVADGIPYSVTSAGADSLPGVTGRERYEPYFRELRAAAESGCFDILGHLDVVKRFDPEDGPRFQPELFSSEIERILLAIIRKGMALEVNTSGFRQHFKEPFPGETILRLYRDLGGKRIRLGSDSHKLRHLATRFAETQAWCRKLGFEEDLS
jgi:histidinol-phosphatase (PHP family)